MPGVQLDFVARHLRCKAGRSVGGDLTEGELLQQFVASHDEAVFNALVQRHGRLVWSVCRNVLRQPEDVEDAFQATFLILTRSAGSIRKQPSVASWLYGVAYRIAM